MVINDLEKSITSATISKVINETFNVNLSEDELTVKKAKAILEDICIQVNKFRMDKNYFIGEQNAAYLSMLATARYLTEYLKEKKNLTEAPKHSNDPVATANMYHKGVAKGLGHGLNTATKFVPHVAGSALGAFVGGLKGQSLQSEHGQVKRVDLEKELEMIDFKNPTQAKSFIDKQLKKHFKQYSPQEQRVIGDYIKFLYQNATAGNGNAIITQKTIESQINKLPGQPFKNITDRAKYQLLVDYFMDIHNGALNAKIKDSKNTKNLSQHPMTPNMNDVISALENLGYPLKNAALAVQKAVDNDMTLSMDFSKLLRAAQLVITK